MAPPLINCSLSTNTSACSNPTNSNSSPTPASTTSAATASQTQACAACKYQRRKCAQDCIFRPYFPHDRTRQFQNAHKLFGVSNITKIIKNLGPIEKDDAMRTIIYQSDARAHDPVGGCFGIILELQRQIDLCQAELDLVLHQLDFFRQQKAVVAIGSAYPFIQAFGELPSEKPSKINDNMDDINHNVVNGDDIAWGMQECSSPTFNGCNDATVMHQNLGQHIIHEHIGNDAVDYHNNCNYTNKQHMGFNIVEQCTTIPSR